MAFFGAGPAEAASQTAATTQALQGVSGLGELGQISASSTSATAGNLLISTIIARNALNNLGFAGPTYGATPYDMAFNVQWATFTNALVGNLAGVAAVQALLGLGTAAQLANTGRRFLINTYYGI